MPNPTQADVARAAGVSRGLVSLALNGSPLVAQATAEHIKQVANRMGYRVNAQAAALASRRSRVIALVLPHLMNPFFDSIAQSLQEAARERGYVLFTVLGGADVIEKELEEVLALRVEGLVFVSPALAADDLRNLGRAVPVCVIGRAGVGGQVDSVRVDEKAAAEKVLEHLRSQGLYTVVYIGPPATRDYNVTERQQCLMQAARQSGMTLLSLEDGRELRAQLEYVANQHLTDGASASAPAGTTKLAQRKQGEPAQRKQEEPAQLPGLASTPAGAKIGLVAHNDVVAIDVLAALRSLALNLPLISYDNTYLAAREEFRLTSVAQPTAVMADKTLQLLVTRAQGLGSEANDDGAGDSGDAGASGGAGTNDDGARATSVPAATSSPAADLSGRNQVLEPQLVVRQSSLTTSH